MKKLIIIASLLLSLNGWAEDENPFRILFSGEPKFNSCYSENPKNPCRKIIYKYEDSIQCFSSNGTRIINLTSSFLRGGIYIHSYKLKGSNQYIEYTKEDGSKGEIRNISDNTPCHITRPDESSKAICVYLYAYYGWDEDEETSMKYCKNKNYKE